VAFAAGGLIDGRCRLVPETLQMLFGAAVADIAGERGMFGTFLQGLDLEMALVAGFSGADRPVLPAGALRRRNSGNHQDHEQDGCDHMSGIPFLHTRPP